MELKETINLMNSSDYKDRFVAEYLQVKIRYDKLKSMVDKWDKGKLNFKPTCPRDIYDVQLKSMKDYIEVLEKRASIENVNLNIMKELGYL